MKRRLWKRRSTFIADTSATMVRIEQLDAYLDNSVLSGSGVLAGAALGNFFSSLFHEAFLPDDSHTLVDVTLDSERVSATVTVVF